MSEVKAKFISKISAKELGFDKKTLRKLCEKSPTSIFKSYGIVTGTRSGDGDNGPWIKFIGQCEAVNMQTGEIVRSGELFLPNSVTNILEAQIIANKNSEGFSGIQYAIEVGVKADDTSATEYIFTAKDLMPAQENDALIKMRESFVDPKMLAKA